VDLILFFTRHSAHIETNLIARPKPRIQALYGTRMKRIAELLVKKMNDTFREVPK